MAGQNIDDTHFQAAEHAISPATVAQLEPRWTLTTAGAISATPTVDDGGVYVPDYGGKLWAVAAGSGRVLWSRDISSYTGVASDQSRTSPAVYGDELILGDGWILSPNTSGARVFAVNRHTGAPLWSTLVDTDPASQITGSPMIYDGVAYLGISSKGEGSTADSFRGAVIALDATTGRLLWKAYMVPSNNGGSDFQQARLLQRQRGMGILLRCGPAAWAALCRYGKQLQRPRRGLYHAPADRVRLARR
jgi:polyvinyl alcohol dehydrogenase (cytochrome)